MVSETNTTQHQPTRLALVDITKQYPGCLANDHVSISLAPGEIHALLGENGAGKSTLVKTIYGIVSPDKGQILWNDSEVTINSPAHARDLGIGMVFQHFSLFETLTVAENIELCLSQAQLKEIGDLSARITELSEHYQLNVDPERYVHTLSIGERQRVEIMRCLVQSVSLLILDEPTSVLTPQEVEGLFRIMRTLSDEGCSILFISHKLHEVTEICHHATILRGGRVIDTCVPSEETPSSIAKMMVGDLAEQDAGYNKVKGKHTVLQAKGLSLVSKSPFGTHLKHIHFELKAGEILGIAGVAGNGQDELMAAISGEDGRKFANVLFMAETDIGRVSVGKRRELGLTYVPEERLGRGAVPEMSLTENLLLTNHKPFVKNGWVDWEGVTSYTKGLINRFRVKCHGEHSEARSLSGGNLQKFIVGREIEQQPKVFMCSHPTWGVDVGAALAIHQAILSLRDAGAAILLISEDIDELFLLADRMGALCDGYLSPIVETESTSIEQIGEWMAGTFIETEGGHSA